MGTNTPGGCHQAALASRSREEFAGEEGGGRRNSAGKVPDGTVYVNH